MADTSLTTPMDTSGPSHPHGNSLALDVAAERLTAGAGVVSSGVSFGGRGPGEGVALAAVSSAASSAGVNVQHGTVLTSARSGFRGIKRPRDKPHGQDYYYRQLRRLKRTIKDFIFINSSVCDEIIRVEEKLARVKEERRYLLRKLLQFQSVSESGAPSVVEAHHHTTPAGAKSGKSPATHTAATPDHAPEVPKKSATKKKTGGATGGGGGGGGGGSGGSGGESKKKLPSQAAKDLLESLQSKPKKSKSQSNRKTIPPMQLDSLGRPVFPMMLGDLTLHSIGEIVPDRNTFNSHDCIYPAGFCSTRVYASMTRPHEKCLYTCKISDCGDLPEFEIAPEEGTEQVFRGSTPNECHVQLLQAINGSLGASVVSMVGHGADFFGLTNPVIQNLIQSCPGAKKCSGYKWIRFEINKAETNENVAVGRNDPTVSVEAFHRLLQQAGAMKPMPFSAAMPTEHSTNLRSLLTKGSVPFSAQM
ncbi:transforming growth factor beta regulator 1-like [Babylonia areolata]|uniref:transforming growth factor beta regulator 1-like n=1 Tax=Babylonia areolata TaxID=304850 RepID=UPI003FD24B26